MVEGFLRRAFVPTTTAQQHIDCILFSNLFILRRFNWICSHLSPILNTTHAVALDYDAFLRTRSAIVTCTNACSGTMRWACPFPCFGQMYQYHIPVSRGFMTTQLILGRRMISIRQVSSAIQTILRRKNY